ncbi:hypothetical protein [Brevundimonas sp.]|uniref:hypothetical protein n=1 Tax=Brevundimonas sp. TaxID=1871086 RepID=UPI003D0F4B38
MSFRVFGILAAGVAPWALAVPADAQSTDDRDRLAVGAVVGSRGVALEAQVAVSDHVVLRGSADLLSWEVQGQYRRTNYEVNTKAQSVGAFIDLHPYANGLVVSGGIYLGEPEIGLQAQLTGPIRLGGATFTPTQVGEVNGRVVVNSAAPFLGVGYDNTFYRDRRWGFRAMLGAAYTGTPRVSLASRGGTLSNNRVFQTRLTAEAREIEDDLAEYRVYPILQLGLNVRF